MKAPINPYRLREKLVKVDQRLATLYGRPKPIRQDPVDTLVGTILSQNTNDRNSGRAYAALRVAFPTWERAADASPADLERVLLPGGLARTKARRIKKLLMSIRDSESPDLRRLARLPARHAEAELLKFDGVGYKTARCVMLFALGMDAFPIDTHIERILRRLDVLPQSLSIDAAHRIIPDLIPKGRALSLHVNLIEHGRKVCHPRKPACPLCPLRRLCRFPATDDAHRP